MSSMVHPRSVPTPLVILVGIGVFIAGLIVSLSRAPGLGVHAQGDCAQPSSSGCPLELNGSAQAALNDPTSTHNWLLNVPVNEDFTLTLANQPVDYGLSVYGPDDALVGVMTGSGGRDSVMRVGNVGTGTYWIVVDSPTGGASDSPYTLVTATVATVPFSSYGTLPARPFQPY